jgi:hypothetical protein
MIATRYFVVTPLFPHHGQTVKIIRGQGGETYPNGFLDADFTILYQLLQIVLHLFDFKLGRL